MEGLLIAQQLERLGSGPFQRGGWRFPDEHTYVLPLAGGSLWLFNRPPNPRLEVREESDLPQGRPRVRFQELLAARVTGELEDVRQVKLDRVVRLAFHPGRGFVETPRVTLIVELTGRNCNLILVDENGTIIGAAREVKGERNRFRQILPGVPYQGPPPYEKLDPRTASEAELREALSAGPLGKLGQRCDGIGPEIAAALGRAAGVDRDRVPSSHEVDLILAQFPRLLADPAAFLATTLDRPDLKRLRQQERRSELVARARKVLERELELTRKRLDDLERAFEAARAADGLRARGDLLLARVAGQPPGRSRVKLEGFDGKEVEVELDPSLGTTENAQQYFRRARKREARARSAQERRPELQTRMRRLEDSLGTLEELPEEELESLLDELEPERVEQSVRQPGARYRGPHGFTVLVGRNSRENEKLTFGVARSRDVWLHAQGYPGSHVLIRAENREVPFDTILFAARLAAGHSKAAESDNVPVDYTLRKNVWRAKGQGPGAVHFSHQKTVYVTPSRRPDETGQ